MKQQWPAALALSLTLALTPTLSEAKRLGSGGMQRSTPTQSAPTAPAGKPAQQQAQPGVPANAAAPAAAAATAGKRSWMGPIAGLAAGLGIAALLSHFGLGEAFANGMMLLLLVLAVAALGFWLMRRLGRNKAASGGAGPLQPAYAGHGHPNPVELQPQSVNRQAQSQWNAAPGSAAASFASGAAAVPTASPALPPDFDRAGFERLAKLIFIRLQAANDKADLNDLRRFTTPEMFASIRLDLQNRGDAQQLTDVQQVEAEVIDLAQEGGMDIVSVRFHGLIREEAQGSVQPFDEVWHLVKPQQGAGDWAIAGIQARS